MAYCSQVPCRTRTMTGWPSEQARGQMLALLGATETKAASLARKATGPIQVASFQC